VIYMEFCSVGGLFLSFIALILGFLRTYHSLLISFICPAQAQDGVLVFLVPRCHPCIIELSIHSLQCVLLLIDRLKVDPFGDEFGSRHRFESIENELKINGVQQVLEIELRYCNDKEIEFIYTALRFITITRGG